MTSTSRNITPLESQSSRVIGFSWGLLLLSFSIGCLTIYWGGVFTDEADILVIGSLLSRQNLLYRDLFSHHFPFPYYWMAVVVNIFGRSIFLARLSIWLFQIVSFAIAMKMSRFHLPLAISAFVWGILRPLYLGNMVLYSSFSGTSLMVVFVITLAILQRKKLATWKDGLVIGLFSAISVLSDPFSALAVTVALLFLLALNLRHGALSSFFAASGILLFTGYLLASGTFQAFWQNPVLFNMHIYSKYLGESNQVTRIFEFFQMAGKGLEATNRIWLNFDPLKPITGGYSEFDQWFFTGFLYRVGLIIGAIFLILKKKYRAALFIYLFAAATLVISKWGFRGQPFFITALVAISAIIIGEWRYLENRYLDTGQTTARILLGAMILWLILRVVDHYYVNQDMLTYEANFAWTDYEAYRIKSLTCNQPEVQLAYYPGGTYLHWPTKMKPVSKYIYMWPWVAEVGLSDVIDGLAQDRILAVVIRYDDLIWGYDTKDYMQPLDEYLNREYKKAVEGVYLSPRLFEICRRLGDK